MLRRSFLAAAAAPSLASAKDSRPYLVQGAVDGELGPLLDALQGKREQQIDAWTFWTGRIGGKPVVISRTEVGTINAVAATLTGIRAFRPRAVINQGTAGGQSRRVKMYDILLGEKTIDYSAFKSTHGDAGSGIDPEKRWSPNAYPFRIGGAVKRFPHFAGDPELIATAEKVVNPRGRVYRACIGSAFQFNKEIDYIDAMTKVFETDSEDMESAYAHGTCVAMSVPFLAIRIISDTEWEHPVFDRTAGQYCAGFVLEVVRRLP